MPVCHDQIVKALMKNRTRLLGYTIVLVGDEHAAEDVLQEISLAAIHKSSLIRDENHLVAWLREAARLKAVELRRNRATQALVISDQVLDCLEGHWRTMDETSPTDQINALRKCLDKLTPRARSLLEMRYSRGLPSGQIASALKQKADTIYKAISRAHITLAQCIQDQLAQWKGEAS